MKKLLLLAALAVCANAQSSVFVPSDGSYVGLSLSSLNPTGACVPSTQVYNYVTGHTWACVGKPPSVFAWTDVTGGGGVPAFSSITGLPTDNAALATALAAKAPTANPSFTGTLNANNLTVTGTCTGCGGGGAAAFSTLTGAPTDNAALSTALAAKAPTASPTFTGTTTANNFTVTGTCTGCSSGGTVTGATLNGSALPVTSGNIILTLPNLGGGPGVAVSALTALDTPYAVDLIDDQTGTSYTIPAADVSGTVRSNNASAVAWTLPQAGLGSNATTGVINFYNGAKLRLMNKAAGVVTVSLSGASHIGVAGTSLTIPAGTDLNPSWVVLTSDGNVLADGGHYAIGENNINAVSGGGPSITSGTYAARPSTCTTNDEYIYTSGAYTLARCTATNTWTTFLNGYPVSVPAEMTLTSNTFNRTSGVTIASTNGFETITATGTVAGSTERYWTAPGTPYTKYVFFNVPFYIDNSNYRYYEAGFEDSTGARLGIQCGVGIGNVSNFYCQVTNMSSSDTFVSHPFAAVNTITGGFAGSSVVFGLQDDGTNVHLQLCSAPGICTEIYNAARASVIGTPSRLYYGTTNTGGAPTHTLAFLGVY